MTDSLSTPVNDAATRRFGALSSPPAAGRALYGSLLMLILSTIAISLYFGGAGDVWGPINDVLVAASVLLLLPAIVAVRDLSQERAGAWVAALTWAAVAGVLIMAAGQLALVLGIIDLETSFITGSVGVLMTIGWLGGTAELALRTRVLGAGVGWWAIAFLIATAVTIVGIAALSTDTPTLTALFGGPLLITLVGWMISLARDLERRAA